MHTIDRGIKQNFCRWQGRLNRKRYIKRMLALWIPGSIICLAAFIAAAAAVLGGNADIAHLNEDQLRQLSYLLQGVSLVLLPFLIPSYMLMIRRLHDLGLSGYFALVSLIPLINLGLTLYLIFAEGTRGANAYGSDPLARDDATEEAAAAETAPARTEDAGSYAGLSLPPIFSKTGRLSRRDYALSIGVIWGGMNIASFAALILLLPLVWLFVNAFFRDTTILFLGFLIAALCMLLVLMYTALPLLAIPATVRRLHDFGHSGFFALPLMLVSLFVGGCVLFLMMIVLGSLGAKGYSPFGMPNESLALVVGTFSILLGLLAFPTGAILVFYTAWVFLKKGDPFRLRRCSDRAPLLLHTCSILLHEGDHRTPGVHPQHTVPLFLHGDCRPGCCSACRPAHGLSARCSECPADRSGPLRIPSWRDTLPIRRTPARRAAAAYARTQCI